MSTHPDISATPSPGGDTRHETVAVVAYCSVVSTSVAAAAALATGCLPLAVLLAVF